MAYYSRVLGADEQVAFIGTLSPVIYSPGVAIVLASLLAFGFADKTPALQSLAYLAFAPAVIGIALMVKQLVRQYTTEIVLTNRRILLKTGLVARDAKDLSLSRIQGADLIQSTFGRVFGYGDVDVKEVGEGSIRISQLSDPLAFRRALSDMIDGRAVDEAAQSAA
jgi:uncharacterized membrane protein YdbT with pleckstrin-like domain